MLVVVVAIIIILRLHTHSSNTNSNNNSMHVDFALPRRCECFELYSGQLQIH